MSENKYTMVVQMGVIKILKEKFESTCQDPEIVERGRFTEDKLFMLEDISSVPFDVPFDFPVTKVVCGYNFAGLLTATGHVFTWGQNIHGELGIDDEKLSYMTQIDHSKPLQFIVQGGNSTKKQMPVVDIECAFSSMIALTDN